MATQTASVCQRHLAARTVNLQLQAHLRPLLGPAPGATSRSVSHANLNAGSTTTRSSGRPNETVTTGPTNSRDLGTQEPFPPPLFSPLLPQLIRAKGIFPLPTHPPAVGSARPEWCTSVSTARHRPHGARYQRWPGGPQSPRTLQGRGSNFSRHLPPLPGSERGSKPASKAGGLLHRQWRPRMERHHSTQGTWCPPRPVAKVSIATLKS